MVASLGVRLACVAGILCVLPTVAAGSSASPEVRDPTGDVAYQGAPVPAGFEWSDIRRAWFDEQDNKTLRLTIEVLGASGPPARGEVGVTFQVRDEYWISGWTVVPPLYSGGFLSKSDKNGDVPAGVRPANAEATWTSNLIVVRISRSAIDPGGNASGLGQPYGWSETHATQGRMHRLDETSVGRAFNWSMPQDTDSSEPSPVATEAKAPGPTAPLLFAALLLVTLAMSRRHRPA